MRAGADGEGATTSTPDTPDLLSISVNALKFANVSRRVTSSSAVLGSAALPATTATATVAATNDTVARKRSSSPAEHKRGQHHQVRAHVQCGPRGTFVV